MERAFAALRSGEASVQRSSDIAGYASPANFATAFRRRFGLTPRDAMKSDRAGRKGSA
ncbi:helix-turn-helix domain-containing protein [Mesorhizobium metallidurans]|uniref:helix-turn-helix domain-containing protein n=1 Tax=Mesorhizobium metallidurans TaxID=489722 RepID=UPI000A02B789